MIIIPLSHELPLWWRTLIAACRTLESFHPCSSFGDRYVVLKRRHVFCCNTDSNPSPVRVEPVSVSTGKSCRENVCRGQRLRRHFRRHQSTARDRDRAFPRLRLRSHGKLKPIPTAARKRLYARLLGGAGRTQTGNQAIMEPEPIPSVSPTIWESAMPPS